MQPSGGQPPGRQPHYGTLYPPSSSGHGQQSYHRPMSDFSLGNVSTRVPSSEAGEGPHGIAGAISVGTSRWVGQLLPPPGTRRCRLRAPVFLHLSPPPAPAPSCLRTASSLGPPALTRCLPRTHRLCPSRYGAHTHWGPCLPLSLCLLPSPSVCFCFGGGMEIVGPRGCVRRARQGQADTPVRRPTSSRSVCMSIAGAVQLGEPINQPGIGSRWLFRRVWIFRG